MKVENPAYISDEHYYSYDVGQRDSCNVDSEWCLTAEGGNRQYRTWGTVAVKNNIVRVC